ncbi:uncharacterized protein LOC132182871 [Corylus avellana]|uniref:uncharacterized protein LOC132182871 n=1 Tax=Corylus avellana TaxID=13451 RepID=UPI00286B2CE4|nr:uncharacterized protein LOC132182871 [Corylus avellana]
MENSQSSMSCEMLDRVAYWVGSNVATAFFASLERCSCINLSTTDLDDDFDNENDDRPLMLSKPVSLPELKPDTVPETEPDTVPETEPETEPKPATTPASQTD